MCRNYHPLVGSNQPCRAGSYAVLTWWMRRLWDWIKLPGALGLTEGLVSHAMTLLSAGAEASIWDVVQCGRFSLSRTGTWLAIFYLVPPWLLEKGGMELQPHDPGSMVLLQLCEASSVFLGRNHCMWLGQTGETQLDSGVMMLLEQVLVESHKCWRSHKLLSISPVCCTPCHRAFAHAVTTAGAAFPSTILQISQSSYKCSLSSEYLP